jgi:hypothetical protein
VRRSAEPVINAPYLTTINLLLSYIGTIFVRLRSLGPIEPHHRRKAMNVSKKAQILTVSAMLPFAAFAATSASAEDDGSAAKGAATGAAVGAVTGAGAAKGAAAGAIIGGAKKNNEEQEE